MAVEKGIKATNIRKTMFRAYILDTGISGKIGACHCGNFGVNVSNGHIKTGRERATDGLPVIAITSILALVACISWWMQTLLVYLR